MIFITFAFAVPLLALGALAQNYNHSADGQVIYQLSPDSEFAYQLEIPLSLSQYQGGSTGEVLRIANQIIPGDFESFYNEFYYVGNELQKYADGLNSTKYPQSARDAYFRSSTYLRVAQFFTVQNTSDPRLYTEWDQAIGNFNKAMALMAYPGVRYNISAPLEIRPNFTSPIIVFKPDDKNVSRPTILFGNGYDDPMEDGYHSICRYALEREWNCVVYEGPGQNTPRRQQQIGFQPDWWNVVAPIVSFLGNRSDVDEKRIALVGESYGGMLAPRAATREHRLAAVISIDGAYSVAQSVFDQFPPQLVQLYRSGNVTGFDQIVNEARLSNETNTAFRWSVSQGLWSFDTSSPYEWLQRATAINFTKDDVELVTAPVWLGLGQNDTSFPGQAATMQSWFGDRASGYNFTNDLGAGQHCQVGAESQVYSRTFDWLQDVFENVTAAHDKQEKASTTSGAEAHGVGALGFLSALACTVALLT